MKIEQAYTSYTMRFESLPEVFRFLDSTPRKWRQSASEHNAPRDNWDLGVGWQGALELARTGWVEGAAAIQEAAMAATGRPVTEREPHWGFDVAGDLPDVGRFMAGVPDNMRRRRKTVGRAPIVTIALGVGTSGGTSAYAMANYGAALAALIDRLEASGRRVELYAISAVIDGGHRIAISVRIKGADEPLDLAAVAFGVGHPAMLRRIVFAARERSPHEMSGYGGTATVEPRDLIDPQPGTLAITGVKDNAARCKTVDGALALAIEQINNAAWSQGVMESGEKLVDRVTE